MLLKKNNVDIVGTLVEIKDHRVDSYTSKDGQAVEYVSTTIVVKSVIDEVENLIELRAFVNKMTKSGTENKNYNTLVNIEGWLNKRVAIPHASITAERFWAKNTSQLMNAMRLSFSQIRLASVAENTDKANFEFGGVVIRELNETVKENADGSEEVTGYKMTLAQANYKEDNWFYVDFYLPKDQVVKANKIKEMYEQYSTIEISGHYCSVVETREQVTETAFGDPIVKTYTSSNKKFIIVSGMNPVTDEESGQYTADVIKALNAAYIKEGDAIKTKASTSESAPATSSATPKAKSMKSALEGLI